ncbi:hypothetical protein M8818_001085 [Zalaria obscura]|uniref:Uncharacterized protein n=1 Tax=Zalaria obscura TaxID=2024903 RepID=A0ACC3SM74_9PEZI
MADDALKCFEYLVTNVPVWIADLQKISQKVEQRQNEHAFSDDLPEPVKPRKSPSMESIRPNIDTPLASVSNVAIKAHPSEYNGRNTQQPLAAQLHLSHRKRKPTSIISGSASAHPKYRPRRMVEVYYDAEAQKLFETLVRGVGTARGQVRKGKMVARMEALNDDIFNTDPDTVDEDKEFANMMKMGYKGRDGSVRNGGGRFQLPRMDAGTQVYDDLDSALEKGQALSEHAAHLFLKDGDCGHELISIRKYLDEVLERSRIQSDILKGKQQRQRRISKERKATERKEAERMTAKPLIPSIHSTSPKTGGGLEVDDESEPEFDVKALGFHRRSHGVSGY